MQIPDDHLKSALHLFAVLVAIVALPRISPECLAAATSGDVPMHSTGNRTVWDREHRRVEHYGNAILIQPGETLTADYILLDLDKRTLDARGSCIYVMRDAIVYGETIHFNLDTKTGTVTKGRVSNATFTLSGDVLRKVDTARYLISHGEFTTCRDCPQSWTFGGDEIDAEFDQYAYITNVVMRVKDAPLAWAPYFIIPLKRTRQSGFLFPGIGVSNELGMIFLLPYYFALHRSADMTLTTGVFTARGPRLQWEGRYQISPLTYGDLSVFYLRDNDQQFSNLRVRSRWSLLGRQSLELPYNTSLRMSFVEVGDNNYPSSGMGSDIGWDGRDTLMSDVALMNTTRYTQSYLMFKRLRGVGYTEVIGTTTNANGDPVEIRRPTGFNPNVVQLLPVFHAATGERVILGSPLSAGLSTTVHHFTRSGENFDCEDPASALCGTKVTSNPSFTAGVDPVRKALRATLVPSLSTSFRPAGVVTVAPSLQYRSFFYRFPSASGLKPLNRGYLLYQTDISAQAERIFEVNGAEVKKVKHLIRPTLTYSLIPFQYQPESHPFVQQIERSPSYKFDAYDVVPYGSTNDYVSYFAPLGHSLSYGVTTQFIRKHKPEGGSEFNTTPLSISAGQTFNFRELGKGSPKVFSRLYTSFGAGLGPLGLGGTYYYYPYFRDESGGRSPHSFLGSASWAFPAGGGASQGSGDRHIKITYLHEEVAGNAHSFDEELVYSLFGFLRPTIGTRYDILTKTFPMVNSSLVFQNPGECWRFTLNLAKDLIRTDSRLQYSFGFELNFTGGPWTDVSGTALAFLSQ